MRRKGREFLSWGLRKKGTKKGNEQPSPKAYVPHAKMWDGALGQVVFVGAADDPSLIVRRKFHHCCGYARVAVISALGGDAKVYHDKYEATMD